MMNKETNLIKALEEMPELKERIEFALIIATYVGMENARIGFEYDCDNAEWREKYLKAASEVELEYEDGMVSSEWAYDMASYIAKKLIAD